MCAKSLDIGTMNCVSSMRDAENKVVYKRARTAFFKIENSLFTSSMLEKTNTPFVVKGNDIIVTSDEALSFAQLMKSEICRPMASGVLNPYEKDSLGVLQMMFENLLGKPSKEKELVVFSVPSPSVDVDNDITYHKEMCKALIEDLGYEAVALPEGMAVIYSSLVKNKFTGLSSSFGAGMVQLAYSHLGAEMFSFSVAKSGDWIDKMVALSQGVPMSKITSIKENKLNLKQKTDDIVLKSLNIYYKNLIEYCLKHMKRHLEKAKNTPYIDGVPYVLAGGTALPEGFVELVKSELGKMEFPIKISEVSMAPEPFYSVSRGCLVFAESLEKKKGAEEVK
jgi:hypothetical protein